MSLVDRWKSEQNSVTFLKEENTVPVVKKGESKDSYMARCVPMVMKEGKTRDQAVGKCYGMYQNRLQKAKQRTVRGYLSPEPGDISKHENKILSETYASAREQGNDKQTSAQIAWNAVNQYKKKKKRKEEREWMLFLKKSGIRLLFTIGKVK